MHNNKLPIGVFDSGVGGLTVLRSLQQHLPHESFLYLGDTARLPYGTKSKATVEKYALQASEFLLNRGIKLLVVACNTASTLAHDMLEQHLTQVPIIGVLEPSSKAACEISKTGNIAVIGTEATVSANGYENSIKKYRPDANVVSKSCGMFVALAEEGWLDGPITEAIINKYLQPILNNNAHSPDCLVLGCTHFPALYSAICKVVNGQVKIIDTATATANSVVHLLAQRQLATTNNNINDASTHYLVTDSPQRFVHVARQFMGRELPLAQIELVDLTLPMAKSKRF